MTSFETIVTTFFILSNFAHSFAWCIKKCHIAKSRSFVFYTLVVILENMPPFRRAIHGIPSFATPASSCVEIYKLCSTFLTSSYKPPPAVFPPVDIKTPDISVTLNSCGFQKQTQQVTLCSLRRCYGTLLKKTTQNKQL
jgi:hypothetical protein